MLLATTSAAPAAASDVEDQASPRRAVPDYDARADPGADAGDVLLWVPRILASPLYLVSEYVLRRPIGWLISTIEQSGFARALLDFFTLEERTGGFAPAGLLDYGFRVSGGFYVFFDDVGFEGHEIRLFASTGGYDWISATLADRYRLSEHAEISIRAHVVRRSDWLFGGIGWQTAESDRSRYQSDRQELTAVLEAEPYRASRLVVTAGVRRVEIDRGTCCGDPALADLVRDGRASIPPGYGGYFAYLQRIDLAFDTRRPLPHAGHGIRIEGHVEHAFALADPVASRWARYGGAIAGYLDVTGEHRVLGLALYASFVDPLGTREVPFTELTVLGGKAPMRGYLEGRLSGRSAAAATLDYRWPIWVWLDGTFFVAAGNVFGPQLEDFAWDRLRISFGGGLRTNGRPDHSFDVMLALGSEPIVTGAALTSVRLFIGTSRGF
ncbi:MAG: BamA/TamA family outer membrane protein [Deltaproteobacteria bacterium]|nr:BamA/TamA family outer membrane protein [Deltaproteobacteria bacterium]